MGMPWQSQPGTYGASKPASPLLLTMTSLRILLTACPMWMSPFAYGGPSCSTKRGRPAAAARIASYTFRSCQSRTQPGSRRARSPRIGNGVSVRFSVVL